MRQIAIAAALVLAAIFATSPAEAQYSRYARPFTPAWAAPQLEVRPGIGPPGTTVLITGARFRRHLRVFYGDVPMRILERGDRYIVAVIPRRVYQDDFIYVIDALGRARTAAPFALAHRRPHQHARRDWPYLRSYPYRGPPPLR